MELVRGSCPDRTPPKLKVYGRFLLWGFHRSLWRWRWQIVLLATPRWQQLLNGLCRMICQRSTTLVSLMLKLEIFGMDLQESKNMGMSSLCFALSAPSSADICDVAHSLAAETPSPNFLISAIWRSSEFLYVCYQIRLCTIASFPTLPRLLDSILPSSPIPSAHRWTSLGCGAAKVGTRQTAKPALLSQADRATCRDSHLVAR